MSIVSHLLLILELCFDCEAFLVKGVRSRATVEQLFNVLRKVFTLLALVFPFESG